jgi:hypothetical protein
MSYCSINGTPSAIGRGACEAGGGTWVESGKEGASNFDTVSGYVSDYWENTPAWEKALDASMVIPGLGLIGLGGRAALAGGRAAHKLYKGVDLGKKAKKVKSLTDPLYRSQKLSKSGKPVYKAGKPVYGGVSPFKLGNIASVGAYPFLASKAGSSQPTAGPSFLTQEQQRAQTVDQKAPEKPKTIAEQMKTKDYWMQPMSGAPGDTRLSRIGRLIGEMGTAPHLRKGSVSDDFAKRANEADAVTQRAAAAQSAGSTDFKTIPYTSFRKEMGGYFDENDQSFLGFGGLSGEEQDKLVNEMYLLHQQNPDLNIYDLPALHSLMKQAEEEKRKQQGL